MANPGHQRTFFNSRGMVSTIDVIFASTGLSSFIKECTVQDGAQWMNGSDHFPVLLKMKLKVPSRTAAGRKSFCYAQANWLSLRDDSTKTANSIFAAQLNH